MRFKLATYNIQYGVGQDGRYDLSRTIAELQGQDIICLQEVTTNWGVCNQEYQPEILAKALNMYATYAPAFEIDDSHHDESGMITNARRGFGNMVLSRWPIVYSRPHSLPRPPTEVPAKFYPAVNMPRTALETVIVIDNTPLRIISLHLSHLPGPQQHAQVEALKSLATSLPEEAPMWENDPRIEAWSQNQPAPPVPNSTLVLGDFNFEPDSEYYTAILDRLPGQEDRLIDGWLEAGGSETDNGSCVEDDGGLSRLDYLFASENMRGKIHGARVNQGTQASDHFPLYFTVEI